MKRLYPLLILLSSPLLSNAQTFYYQGTITFRVLAGQDCGETKAGGARAVILALASEAQGVSGYYQMEGGDAVRLSGKRADALELESPDPADARDHLSLQGVGGEGLEGRMQSAPRQPDAAGCFLVAGDIAARQADAGEQAGERMRGLEQAFDAAREEYAARQRAPEAYAELQRIAPELAGAEAEGSEDMQAALRLREQQQPLWEQAFGAESTAALGNLAKRARLHERLNQFDLALPLRQQALSIATRRFPQQIAAMAYNLGDLLEKLGRKQEAAAAFSSAAQADEQRYGPDHPEVADDLQRQARLLEALQRKPQAIALYQRILSIREKTPDAKPETVEQAQKDLAHARDAAAFDALAGLEEKLAQSRNENNLAGVIELRRKMWPLAEQCYGKPSRYLADLLHALVNDLETLDRDQEALALYPEVLAQREASYGKAHAKTANTLFNYAYQSEKMGHYPQALTFYRRALESYEKSVGPEHESTLFALNAIASMHVRLGQYVEALPLLQRALAVRETALGPEHADTAGSLNNLAILYDRLGQYDKALPLLQRALAIREKVLGPEHADTAISLMNLADAHEKLGQYDQALPLYQRALAINEKVFGPDRAETAISLNFLARFYRTVGQYAKALPLYRRVLAIRENTLGPEHVDTAVSLAGLALVYDDLGQFDTALPLHQRALAIREKVLGAENVDTADSLNNLARAYRILGQYDKALPLFQRALAIRERILGQKHPSTAISLTGLAYLYLTLGQYDQALPLFQRALAIDEQVYGPDNANTARSLNNLAASHNALGQYAQALPLYQRALAIYEKTLGVEHEETASALNNLAIMHNQLGQYDRALPLFQRALAIREKVFGPHHPDTALSLSTLAVLLDTMGKYDQALPLYQRALTIYEKTLGPEHELTSQSLSNLASFYGVQHRPGEALDFFERARRITDHVITRVFPVLTEQQKLMFVQKQEGDYRAMLSLIHRQLPGDAAAIRAGLDLVLSRKGIVFDAQARQQETIARSLDPETKKLWDELAGQRAQYAKLLQNRPENMPPEAYKSQLKTLQDGIARLEGAIAGKSALVAEEFKQHTITAKEVARVLGKQVTLAEFVKIHDYDWDNNRWADTWRYLAFVLKGDGSVSLVDLGDAATLEQAVLPAIAALGNLNTPAEKQQAASQTLGRLLWQPLSAAVGTSSRITFSPDGLLNLVPFAAMQDDAGRYLIETRQISYATSGRDLAKGDTGVKPELALYLAANPAFDFATGPADAVLPNLAAGTPTRSGGFAMHFNQLPGTEQEARQVPDYLSGKQAIVTGKDATEDSVLNARRPRVMHLATHGFFLQDQIGLDAEGTRGATRIKADQPVSLPKNYENPLVRSGLALAGANHASAAKGERDGLLTALEVSGMDLHGTDLVTLSACETGRGDVKSGEGVFGLRRAFALAGARNLIMSLWPVSDAVTAQQMQRFYQLYGKHMEPAAALREAQLATIADLRTRKGHADPALWAPFIVQGR